MMRAGRLRHRVTIQEQVRVAAGGGSYTVKWATYSDTWAEIEPIDPVTERNRGDSLEAPLRYRVRLRDWLTLRPDMRVLYNSRALAIIAGPMKDELGRSVGLICEEVNP